MYVLLVEGVQPMTNEATLCFHFAKKRNRGQKAKTACCKVKSASGSSPFTEINISECKCVTRNVFYVLSLTVNTRTV